MVNIQTHRQTSLDIAQVPEANAPRKHYVVKKAGMPGFNTSFLTHVNMHFSDMFTSVQRSLNI